MPFQEIDTVSWLSYSVGNPSTVRGHTFAFLQLWNCLTHLLFVTFRVRFWFLAPDQHPFLRAVAVGSVMNLAVSFVLGFVVNGVVVVVFGFCFLFGFVVDFVVSFMFGVVFGFVFVVVFVAGFVAGFVFVAGCGFVVDFVVGFVNGFVVVVMSMFGFILRLVADFDVAFGVEASIAVILGKRFGVHFVVITTRTVFLRQVCIPLLYAAAGCAYLRSSGHLALIQKLQAQPSLFLFLLLSLPCLLQSHELGTDADVPHSPV